MTEVLATEHKTPKVSDTEKEKRRRAACMSWYGYLFVSCGYCGGYHHKDYVCHCGFQVRYNDSGQLVWSDAR